MKHAPRFNSAAYLIAIASYLFFFESCTSSSTVTVDDPNSGSIAGTWILKSIQCLSAPSDDFPCWKNFLVPLGEINMLSNSTSVLTISADGTYIGDETPKIDTLPASIFSCEKGNLHSSKKHISGTYSASEGLIILHNDDDLIDGAYLITSTTFAVTLNLPRGERWKVNFTK